MGESYVIATWSDGMKLVRGREPVWELLSPNTPQHIASITIMTGSMSLDGKFRIKARISQAKPLENRMSGRRLGAILWAVIDVLGIGISNTRGLQGVSVPATLSWDLSRIERHERDMLKKKAAGNEKDIVSHTSYFLNFASRYRWGPGLIRESPEYHEWTGVAGCCDMRLYFSDEPCTGPVWEVLTEQIPGGLVGRSLATSTEGPRTPSVVQEC